MTWGQGDLFAPYATAAIATTTLGVANVIGWLRQQRKIKIKSELSSTASHMPSASILNIAYSSVTFRKAITTYLTVALLLELNCKFASLSSYTLYALEYFVSDTLSY